MASINTIQSSTSGMMTSNIKSFEQYSSFLSGIDVTHQNLDSFTAYIRGISRLFMHKPPQFMTEIMQDETRQFKTMIESQFKSIGGISDIEVEFTDFEAGFNLDKFSTVQSSKDNTDTLTVSLYELQGSPLRVYLDTWVSGVRDPRTGVAHYHGVIADGIMNYATTNHTSEFIYTTMDPTAKKMEYCCMFANCFPTKVPKDHLNFEGGNRDGVQMDLEFRTKKYESPAINDIGAWYLTNSMVNYNYLDFDPNMNGTGYNAAFTYAYGSGSTEPIKYPSTGL